MLSYNFSHHKNDSVIVFIAIQIIHLKKNRLFLKRIFYHNEFLLNFSILCKKITKTPRTNLIKKVDLSFFVILFVTPNVKDPNTCIYFSKYCLTLKKNVMCIKLFVYMVSRVKSYKSAILTVQLNVFLINN